MTKTIVLILITAMVILLLVGTCAYKKNPCNCDPCVCEECQCPTDTMEIQVKIEEEVAAISEKPSEEPDYHAMLLAQEGMPVMDRIGVFNGVINVVGLPVDILNIDKEDYYCIHDMPLNWTCMRCPHNQRVWREPCTGH